MNETCRRTACPSEAADCSAARSGSASRTATSVIAEDINFSSCARQASSARNQNSAIGRQTVAAATTIIGLAKNELPAGATSEAAIAHASRAPTASQPPDAPAASWKGAARGLLLQSEDQAADRGRIVIGGDLGARRTRRPPLGDPPRACGRPPAGRRRCYRALPLALLPGFSAPSPAVGNGLDGAAAGVARRQHAVSAVPLGSSVATGPGRALGGLALRLSVLSHSPFQFRCRAGHRTP